MTLSTRIGMLWAILLSVAGASTLAQEPSESPDVERDIQNQARAGFFVESYNPWEANRNTAMVGSRPRAPVLVIPSGPVDKDEMPPIVEDMEIMSQILDKTLGRRSTGRVARHVTKVVDDVLAQGRNNPVFPAGPYDQTRGVFLEGYGAVFLTEVDYPLSPGPDMSEQPEQGEVEESIWEETKRELGFPRKPTGELLLEVLPFDVATYDPSSGLTMPYDAKRVEQLQKTLLETLKHATNIRSLKPEDSVAVVVQGADLTIGPGPGGRWRLTVDTSGPSVLTLRVRRSDIDAFARGELSFDAWRKKVTIVTY